MTARRVMASMVAGTLRAPPSKSYTHRALLAGHLARHAYRIRNPLYSADTLATRSGIRALGTRTTGGRTEWRLNPRPPAATEGRPRVIPCGESGTTLRFLAAAAARGTTPVRFTGAPGLAARPMGSLVAALRHAGVRVDSPARGSLPMTIEGPLRAGTVRVAASISSQYVSALLLTLPTLAASSRLIVVGEPVSQPYVEATLAVLRAHRIQVHPRRGGWIIPGGQSYRGARFTVPGDASSAAYLWASAALTGGTVTVTGIPVGWPQADRRILVALREAGARVREQEDSVTVSGPILQGFDLDLTESPDLYPLLGAVAACGVGRSRLRGARQVAFKESDRRAATVALVRRIGGQCRAVRGGLEITAAAQPRGVRGFVSADHRVVMSAAVAGLVGSSPSKVAEAECVAKSYPGFWRDLAHLGAGVKEGA